MTIRRPSSSGSRQAEDVRNRALRREAQAREDKEATRQGVAIKSAALRALRLARAASAGASSKGIADYEEAAPQPTGDD